MNNYARLSFLLIVILLAFLSSSLSAQCDVNFEDEIYLENQYRKKNYAQIGALTSGENFYKVNDTLSFDLGFKKAVWVAAYGADDSLKVAANTVVTNGKRDFVGGPVIEEGQSQSAFCSFYTRVWHVTAAEVTELREAYDSGTLTEDDIPLDIWEWPAKNNEALGDYAPSNAMAPFYDFNDNGVYDPLNGDYPLALDDLPAFIPESFAFTVYNDNIEHTSSDVDSLIIEFHQMDYIMSCDDGGPVERSVFTRLKYIYKGDLDLRDLKIGIWKLGHLGCFTDDLLGVNVDLNTTYSYNAGGFDQQNCVEGDLPIPEGNGAISTQIFLNNVMDQSMYHHFQVFGSFPLATYSPRLPIHYMNNLSSKWRDGKHITQGGIAYDTLSSENVKFTFPDYPTDISGWSMQRVVAPFTNVASVTTLHEKDRVTTGYTGHIDYADHIVYDGVSQGYEIFDIYEEEVNTIKNTYLNVLYGSSYCGVSSIEESTDLKNKLKVYPNPTNGILHIQFAEAIEGQMSIYNALGKQVFALRLNSEMTVSTISTAEFNAGVYYLVVSQEDGSRYSTSFIKQG